MRSRTRGSGSRSRPVRACRGHAVLKLKLGTCIAKLLVSISVGGAIHIFLEETNLGCIQHSQESITKICTSMTKFRGLKCIILYSDQANFCALQWKSKPKFTKLRVWNMEPAFHYFFRVEMWPAWIFDY